MDWYPWVVLIHVVSVTLFFVAHGTSMSVAFRLLRERDPQRVRALLDISSWSMGAPASVAAVVGLLSGIAAGFMGNWWGQIWIWASLVLFVGVGFVMTPLAASRFRAIREAAGIAAVPMIGAARNAAPPEPGAGDPAELQRLLDTWNPAPIAGLGLSSLIVILWLMLLKPF
jgi:hypothetical protein